MTPTLSFLRLSWLSPLVCLSAILFQVLPANAHEELTTESLTDWTDWNRYRNVVRHPVLGIKPADLQRAAANGKKHAWARRYISKVEAAVTKYVDKLSTGYLTRMIPETTPLSGLFTPCPACRELGKPYQPHGTWKWSPTDSEKLHCTVCKTIYPNVHYPESVAIHSSWGQPQTFTYYGGETFPIFSWKHGRPSFSGNIRSQKVSFMSQLARQFAAAYSLTGNAQYAESCRKILLRLSQVYPGYLVHCAYGEVADMSPRDAAFSMNRLPAPELTYPPNKPDNNLFKRFWTAGRASGTGMEGVQMRQWAEAYDLTCDARTSNGATIYSDADRVTIERDLLLESTVLAVADPQMNNKSIGNRSAVGLVGACVGHPAMVRFSLEGFRQMVDEYFLPDGGTPESISYGFMAVAGVRDLSLAFREYSDPPGYRDSDGKCLDDFRIFRDSNYPRIWDAFLDCLLPDLTFPPFADSREVTRFPPADLEILASVYPDEPRYAAVLDKLSSPTDAPPDPAMALYMRSPDFPKGAIQPLTFPDHCRPDLRLGFMRSGHNGDDGLLLLSATHWGIHRHLDSLNLSYWKDGHELLTDLGYLWDHADEEMTYRTFAHNLVIIDGKDQQTRKRGGDVEMFFAGNRLKAMRASSRAYPNANLYRRTSGLIDHGNGRSYAVDLFEVDGGETQDYVYHGPTALYETTGIPLSPSEPLYDLTKVEYGHTTSPWSITWPLRQNLQFTSWNVPQEGESTYIGSGWGQRDSKNRDRGTTIPYIIRRREGKGPKQFLSVFEGSAPGEGTVKNVRLIDGGSTLQIETSIGTDYIIWSNQTSTQLPGQIEVPPSAFTVVSTAGGDVSWTEKADWQ